MNGEMAINPNHLEQGGSHLNDDIILNLTLSGHRKSLIDFLEKVAQAEGVAVLGGSFTLQPPG